MQTTEAARGIRTVWRVAVDGMTEAELLEARMTEEGSIADYRVERCAKLLKENEAPYLEQGCCQLVSVEGMVCAREGQRRVEGDVLREVGPPRQARRKSDGVPISARRFREQTIPSRI